MTTPAAEEALIRDGLSLVQCERNLPCKQYQYDAAEVVFRDNFAAHFPSIWVITCCGTHKKEVAFHIEADATALYEELTRRGGETPPPTLERRDSREASGQTLLTAYRAISIWDMQRQPRSHV